MRIRALAQLLSDAVREAPTAQRQVRIDAFLRTLARSRQWKLLPRIVATLERFESEAGVPPVEVRTPAGSAPAAPAHATLVRDADLVAGAVVRSGDAMVDTSLKTQLSRLAQALKS